MSSDDEKTGGLWARANDFGQRVADWQERMRGGVKPSNKEAVPVRKPNVVERILKAFGLKR